MACVGVAQGSTLRIEGGVEALTGLLTGVRAFAAAYTYYGVAGRPDPLPGVEYAAWVGSWVGAPGVLLAATLLLLVFPTAD